MTTKRAAIYLRVSTDDQDEENQRPDVERLCAARGFEISHSFEEKVSATKRRPQFAAMLDAARRREFDVLVIWAIDRFGRSMAGNVRDVLELDRLAVTVVSVQESWLDTAGPVRDLLLAIFSWVSEQELRRNRERTLAGMARARAQGKRIGRPRRMARLDVERAAAMQAEGRSIRQIAVAMKVPRPTIARELAKLIRT